MRQSAVSVVPSVALRYTLGMSDIRLNQLIQNHLDATGMNKTDLARATGLSRSRIIQLLNDAPLRMPRNETLEKLAAGLNIPLSTVTTAALTSVGISSTLLDQSERLKRFSSYLDQLTAEDLEYAEIFLAALAAKRRG